MKSSILQVGKSNACAAQPTAVALVSGVGVPRSSLAGPKSASTTEDVDQAPIQQKAKPALLLPTPCMDKRPQQQELSDQPVQQG